MPKRYTAKELIKIIEKDGWVLVRVKGSHHIFEHNEKSGTVVVPVHSGTMPVRTANGILKQAKLKIH